MELDLVKSVVQVVNVLTALAVVGLVLVQHGKGADMGAAFGGGSAGSLFGSSGSANFLSRTTAVCATIFFVTLFALVKIDSLVVSNKDGVGIMEKVSSPASVVVPANKDAGADAAKDASKPVIPN